MLRVDTRLEPLLRKLQPGVRIDTVHVTWWSHVESRHMRQWPTRFGPLTTLISGENTTCFVEDLQTWPPESCPRTVVVGLNRIPAPPGGPVPPAPPPQEAPPPPPLPVAQLMFDPPGMQGFGMAGEEELGLLLHPGLAPPAPPPGIVQVPAEAPPAPPPELSDADRLRGKWDALAGLHPGRLEQIEIAYIT